MAKAPHRNPYGEEEEPKNFNDFDILMRIKILHQLSVWTFGNADRMRGSMPDDEDHLNWRMEPLGWDKEDRAYFVLDDNRLYRRTDEVPRPLSPKPKAKSKSKKATKRSRTKGTRTSKRRKIEQSDDEQEDVEVQDEAVVKGLDDTEMIDDEPAYGFTSKTWECIAITLEEYQYFLASLFRSRDPNEKLLRKRIEDDVVPIIEKRAEAMRQKEFRRLKEIENLQKMATAKRSSRIAGKAERERHEREEREAEEKRQRDLKMALEEQERLKRIEEGHESRRMTREQRVKEREAKRILHQEELARIEEQADRAESQDPESDPITDNGKRVSERQLKSQREQHQKELERLAEEEETWVFDCAVCGVHGENLDDGTHSIACEKCNVWQHSKCHQFSPKQAESDGFHFICNTCKRKERDALKPKIAPIKLKNPHSSPAREKNSSPPSTAAYRPRSSGLPEHVQRQLDYVELLPTPRDHSTQPISLVNGLQHATQNNGQLPPGPVQLSRPDYIQALSAPEGTWCHSSPPTQLARPFNANITSPPQINGYGPPQQHNAQHHQMHQQALSSSGIPPNHVQPQYQFINRTPSTSNTRIQQTPVQTSHSPYQTFRPPAQLQPSPNFAPPFSAYQPNQSHRGPVPAANGSTSPTKTRTPSHSFQSFNGQLQPIDQSSPRLTHSPKTALPPATNLYQQSGHSPVKSSPPVPPRPVQTPDRSVLTPPKLAPSPSVHHYPPSASNYQTSPQRSVNLSGSANRALPNGSSAAVNGHLDLPRPKQESNYESIGRSASFEDVVRANGTTSTSPLDNIPKLKSPTTDASLSSVPVKKLLGGG